MGNWDQCAVCEMERGELHFRDELALASVIAWATYLCVGRPLQTSVPVGWPVSAATPPIGPAYEGARFGRAVR